jgi:hypothetical protein
VTDPQEAISFGSAVRTSMVSEPCRPTSSPTMVSTASVLVGCDGVDATLGVPAGNDHRSPGPSEQFRGLPADPGGRAGHQCEATGSEDVGRQVGLTSDSVKA